MHEQDEATTICRGCEEASMALREVMMYFIMRYVRSISEIVEPVGACISLLLTCSIVLSS